MLAIVTFLYFFYIDRLLGWPFCWAVATGEAFGMRQALPKWTALALSAAQPSSEDLTQVVDLFCNSLIQMQILATTAWR